MVSRNILIVEDEAIVRLHLRRLVEAMGHRVCGVAANADEALASAAAEAPDLVLLDIQLRGDRDGIDVARDLVARHGCAVIFATAYADDETLRRTEGAGAIGYLLKPFGVQAVRAAITTALGEHERGRISRASEKSLASIVGTLGEAVIRLDGDLRVTFLNPKAQALAWAEGDEYLGRAVSDILHPASDDLDGFFGTLERARADRTAASLPTMALQLPGGREALFDGSIEPIADGTAGQGFVVSLRDLSARWFHADRRVEASGDRQPRMVIYSHDTFGLGHLRRSLNLASALVAAVSDLSVLIVTGSAVAHRFTLPPRVDYVKLPAVRKTAQESYAPRSLAMSDDDVRSIRANLVLRTVRDFRPDLFLVDHSPEGMRGELRPTLAWLREHNPECEVIIGLRDIIDDPAAVIETWRQHGIYRLLEDTYDHVVVYGHRSFYDPVTAYAFPPALASRVRFVGHVVEDVALAAPTETRPGRRPRVVVTTGGGDGAVDEVAGGFLAMLRDGGGAAEFETPDPPGTAGRGGGGRRAAGAGPRHRRRGPRLRRIDQPLHGWRRSRGLHRRL